MAHIVSCIADIEPGNTIVKPLPPGSYSDMTEKSWLDVENQKMQTQTAGVQVRRYQLFPQDIPPPVLNNTKAADAEKTPSTSSMQRDEKTDVSASSFSLKNKITQHSLVRRRKISVPELGPMTTVQEIPMDSPTIPGRPPIHERSISAPADDGRQQQHSYQQQPLPLDSLAFTGQNSRQQEFSETMDKVFESISSKHSAASLTRKLAPLVIPAKYSRGPQQSAKDTTSTAQKGGIMPNTRTPCTPSTSSTDVSTYSTAGNLSTTTLPTPVSAPSSDPQWPSSKHWEGRSNTPTMHERSMTPQPAGSQRIVTSLGHRRGASESSGYAARGRPRRTADLGPRDRSKAEVRSGSTEKSLEQKSFEELPKGFHPKDAAEHLSSDQWDALYKQAYGQAERFEVLKPEDVEALSKELRRLDERTAYLRRTYTSLRAGRRSLHSRICQFLRSPRVARFSYESMLKQEEALSELDASIDEWVSKLEAGDNRHTRVRQKLLEHVAGAAILASFSNAPPGSDSSASSPNALGMQPSAGVGDISTPPRSPTKQGCHTPSRASTSSPSPQRVVAQVPSTILENPIVEEAEGQTGYCPEARVEPLRRNDVESIRIYAGDDIATLLADVEKEITRISREITDTGTDQDASSRERELNRQRSQSLLDGSADAQPKTVAPREERCDERSHSPPPPPPPLKDFPANKAASEGEQILPHTVFKP